MNNSSQIPKEYFCVLEVPGKQLVIFETPGRGMIGNEAGLFHRLMVESALPETYR